MRTLKNQGVVAPGSLVVKEGQSGKEPRDRIFQVSHSDWGQKDDEIVVPNHRIWRGAAIDAFSETSGVWIGTKGNAPPGRSHNYNMTANQWGRIEGCHIVTNRSPLMGPLEGPLVIRPYDPCLDNDDADVLPQQLRLNLYPYEPTWLPDKRGPMRYFHSWTGEPGGTEVEIMREWFRGREGLMIFFDVGTMTGAHDWHVYAGVCHRGATAIGYDEIATGSFAANTDVITHWEGRADVIKITYVTTSTGNIVCKSSMYFRDEF